MPRRSRRGGIPEWLAQSQLPVFVVDSRRVMLFFNRGCELLTGWSAADLIGKVCEWTSTGQPDESATLLSALCPPIATTEQLHRGHILTRSGASLDRVIRFYPLIPAEESDADEPIRWLGVIEVPSPAQVTAVTYDSELHAELSAVKSELRKRFSLTDVVASSSSMRHVLSRLQLAVDSFVPVAFCGAAGTGKEHLARAVHYAGPTRVRAFVPVDCRLPRRELDPLLFQLIAPEREAPPIPVLRLGAVLLRHVEQLPSDWQRRLLDEVVFESGGEAVRWMIASEIPFSDLVQREILLPEFAERFGIIEVTLPALRERNTEFDILVQQALEVCNHGGKQIQGFTPEVWDQLRSYLWPGNLEELFDVVRSAHQTATAGMITTGDLPFRFRAGRDAQSIGPAPSVPLVPLEERLMQVEREQLELALARAGGNKQLAAELLGIPRPKLYRRLEAHGMLSEGSEETGPR